MWCLSGNGTWSWLCLLPFLVMLGFMVMMVVLARRRCMGWTGGTVSSQKLYGDSKMEKQAAHKWKGMQGSMMQSCMEMMSRRMPAATRDTGLKGAFERWSQDLEQKILALLDQRGSVGPAEIASALGIPEEAAVSLIHRLALDGKVRIGSVEKAQQTKPV